MKKNLPLSHDAQVLRQLYTKREELNADYNPLISNSIRLIGLLRNNKLSAQDLQNYREELTLSNLKMNNSLLEKQLDDLEKEIERLEMIVYGRRMSSPPLISSIKK